jgi:hypothetical protein
MKLIRVLANIAAVVGLFFAFIVPVGRLVFSETGGYLVVRLTSWLGIFRNSERGDSHVSVSILISIFLAISLVWLVNVILNQYNRKRQNIR